VREGKGWKGVPLVTKGDPFPGGDFCFLDGWGLSSVVFIVREMKCGSVASKIWKVRPKPGVQRPYLTLAKEKSLDRGGPSGWWEKHEKKKKKKSCTH